MDNYCARDVTCKETSRKRYSYSTNDFVYCYLYLSEFFVKTTKIATFSKVMVCPEFVINYLKKNLLQHLHANKTYFHMRSCAQHLIFITLLGNDLTVSICLCCFIFIARRATTVEQVYVVSGYPKESSPGVLQVAVFVSTGDNKFLSKDVLVVIVEEFRGNLSDALGKRITGWGRLHIDFAKTTESTGSSGKNRVLYYFFAGFAGVVLVLVVFVSVTCW